MMGPGGRDGNEDVIVEVLDLDSEMGEEKVVLKSGLVEIAERTVAVLNEVVTRISG
jgi:hypothetical protein